MEHMQNNECCRELFFYMEKKSRGKTRQQKMLIQQLLGKAVRNTTKGMFLLIYKCFNWQ